MFTQEYIFGQLHSLLEKNFFVNHLKLHPRELPQFCKDESSQFISYLETGNVGDAKDAGRRWAELGISEKIVLHFFGILKQHVCSSQSFKEMVHFSKRIDCYTEQFLTTFIDVNKKRIIDNQELLRKSIVMSLEEQKTKREEIESRLRQSQKMEAMGQMAGGIAHDFNNILQIVIGLASLEQVRQEKDQDSIYSNTINEILIAAHRGAELTKQLRFFTRQERGEKRLTCVNELIQETYKLLRRTLPNEIDLNIKLNDETSLVFADSSQISQVLINLCLNARDAMMLRDYVEKHKKQKRKIGGQLIIESYSKPLDHNEVLFFPKAKPGLYRCIAIKDTGIGMAPEVSEHIFEPFFTTKDAKKGTGLGLAVVYGIIKNHDGFIDVKSQVGVGSSFVIYLPVSSRVEKPEALIEKKTKTLKGKGTVLIIDDEKQVVDYVESVLAMTECKLLVAPNGEEGLKLYKKHQKKIKLVLLDMVMPKMSGIDVLKRIRLKDDKVPIIMITGFFNDMNDEQILKASANAILRKPFTTQVLIDEIGKFLLE
jgi:two-component system cell cycle sensor histidine kinase/response regulator CckA